MRGYAPKVSNVGTRPSGPAVSLIALEAICRINSLLVNLTAACLKFCFDDVVRTAYRSMVSLDLADAVVCLNWDFFDFDVQSVCVLPKLLSCKVSACIMYNVFRRALVCINPAYTQCFPCRTC